MRDNILSYLKANPIQGFGVTEELPWDATDNPLYLKNMKQIYVNQPQTAQDPIFDTLDGGGAVDETTTVTVYVATDAKNLPPQYDKMVSTLRQARLLDLTQGWRQRLTQVATSYDYDALVTEFTFNFTKLIINKQEQ
jgi:hypothetical protein